MKTKKSNVYTNTAVATSQIIKPNNSTIILKIKDIIYSLAYLSWSIVD